MMMLSPGIILVLENFWGRVSSLLCRPQEVTGRGIPRSYVTHETKHFIYFYLGQVAVLLFKSG